MPTDDSTGIVDTPADGDVAITRAPPTVQEPTPASIETTFATDTGSGRADHAAADPATAPTVVTTLDDNGTDAGERGPDDVTEASDGLGADPGDDLGVDFPCGYPGDEVLFDSLLCDEPIDLAAVRADDALIDALGGGDLAAARDLVDADDPLIAMLAAWAASARPDEPQPAPARPSLSLVVDDDLRDDGHGKPGGPTDRDDNDTVAPVVPLVTPMAGVARAVPTDTAAQLPPSTLVGEAPTAVEADTDPPAADPAVAATTPTDGVLRHLVPVRKALDRARGLRRTTPAGRLLPPDHPLRRAAVVIVLAALGVSGAAAAGGTAQPGDAGFTITRVFFSERARSLEAAQVVSTGLQRARVYLDQRQPDLAAHELAQVDRALPAVRDQDGRTQLVDQKKVLAEAVAGAPPETPVPASSSVSTAARPDTSVLAEGTPPVDATAPTSARSDPTRPERTDTRTAPNESVLADGPPAGTTTHDPADDPKTTDAGPSGTGGSTGGSTADGGHAGSGGSAGASTSSRTGSTTAGAGTASGTGTQPPASGPAAGTTAVPAGPADTSANSPVETHAAGSVTASSSGDDTSGDDPGKAVLPVRVSKVPKVVTTVPAPVVPATSDGPTTASGSSARPKPTAAAKQTTVSSDDRPSTRRGRHATDDSDSGNGGSGNGGSGNGGSGHGDVAGARVSGTSEANS